jgi:preprotein translocase subunit SecG
MFEMLLQPQPLLALHWSHWAFIIPLCLLSVFLTLLILVQRGRGGGLTGALGGMGGQSAFGTKAGDVFTKITIIVAMGWILLSMGALRMLHVGKFDSSNVTAPAGTGDKKGGDPTGTDKKGMTTPLDTPPTGPTPENTPAPKANTPAPSDTPAAPAPAAPAPTEPAPKNDDQNK